MSLFVFVVIRDFLVFIGGKDCFFGWLSGGSKNVVGLSGWVGFIDVCFVKLMFVVFLEEIFFLIVVGECLLMLDEFCGDVEVDNKICGVLYCCGNWGFSFLFLLFGDDVFGRFNWFFIKFFVLVSFFWIFFFLWFIFLLIDFLWKFMELSWIFSFLFVIEFMNIVLFVYLVFWYVMVLWVNREVSVI